jgi:hypothetical protein
MASVRTTMTDSLPHAVSPAHRRDAEMAPFTVAAMAAGALGAALDRHGGAATAVMARDYSTGRPPA